MSATLLKRVFGAGVAAVRSLAVFAALTLAISAQAAEFHNLQQAQLQSAQGSRAVVLPHQLESHDFLAQGSQVRYVLELDLPQVPDEALGILVNKISLSGRVWLNGQLLGACASGAPEMQRCLYRPWLIAPPQSMWKAGRNRLEFEVYANARQSNGLSAVRVDSLQQLEQGEFAQQYFVRVLLMEALSWITVVLGLLSLMVAFYLRGRTLYLWVGLASLVHALSNINFLSTLAWPSPDMFSWFAFSSRMASTPLLILACMAFYGKDRAWHHALALGYAAFGPLLVWFSGNNRTMVSLFYVPVLVACVVALMAMVRWTWQSRKLSHAFMLVTALALLVAGYVDWQRLRGTSAFEGVYLMAYASAGFLVIMSTLVMAELAAGLLKSRQLTAQLKLQVADQSQELLVAQDRISGMERTLLKLTENIPVGTYVLETNAKGEPRFTFVSDRFLKMLDLRREDVLADPSVGFRCVHPDEFEAFMAQSLRVFAQMEPFSWAGRIVVHGEVRWLSMESTPRPLGDGGATWEGVMIDITAARASEEALKEAYEKLIAVEAYRSTQEERERLLQDMHDGFGSQLSSARIMAEQGALDQRQLQQLLQECMSDLYLVVDTLGSSGKTLAVALGDFRFRTHRRTAALPVQMHWDQDLEQAPTLPDRTILQILRVLQEAVNNALKHAKAANIWVDVMYLPEEQLLQARVRDDGEGISDKAPRGRGLSNMQQRASEIGASLQVAAMSPGTQVLMRLQL